MLSRKKSSSGAGVVLPAAWFERCPVEAARLLLGAHLCRRMEDGSVLRWRVTETEAYNGAEDLACHASKGLTPRTAVLFGPPGHWYVYLCYGVHWMLNVVTREAGYPSAVLLRGVAEPVSGSVVFDGPGKLTKALGIDKRFNTAAATRETGLWLEETVPVPDAAVSVGPRIGVDYAGPVWAGKPWRFVLMDFDSHEKAQKDAG